ncbi:MAG: hypothetical protein Q9161_005709 [Pseudevernia consocians]
MASAFSKQEKEAKIDDSQISDYTPSPPTTTIRAISTTSPKTPPPESSPTPSAKLPALSLPHLTPSSEIHLISTSAKSVTHRVAVAIGHVRFSNHEPLHLIRQNAIKKGDVLAVARIAAVQAVKKTSDFIPLAHGGVPVEGCIVRVEPVGFSDFDTQPENSTNWLWEGRRVDEPSRLSEPIGMYGGVRISVQVETTAKTGVEMEALTGVVGAALTVVDMCKGVDKGCVIDDVRVVGKKGGRNGGWGIWREDPDQGLDDQNRPALLVFDDDDSLAIRLLRIRKYYSAQAKYGEARTTYGDLLLRLRSEVGLRKRYTIHCVRMMAKYLRDGAEAAQEMQYKALSAFESLYGASHHLVPTDKPAHPRRLRASLRARSRTHSQAIRSEMLRQDHRITLDAANGLGSLYTKEYCWDDANYYPRQAVDGYSRNSETIQPARDEKALKAMEGMAIALYNRKSFEAAEQMARGLFEVREDLHGRYHPDTLQTATDLAIILQQQA